MGVVVQAGHDDVDEGGGEAFRQRRRDGRTNTTSNLVSDEVGRYTVEGHEAHHELPHEHAKSVHVAKETLGPARKQLGRRPRTFTMVQPRYTFNRWIFGVADGTLTQGHGVLVLITA